MFTGIVQGISRVMKVTDLENSRRMCVDLGDLIFNLKQGASVSINGVCLSVTSIEKNLVEFDIILESLRRSNLGNLKIGEYVNIERACRLGDEIGGHQISGHVDCIGEIQKIIKKNNIYDIFVKCETKWFKYLFPKGWIAVDGISLTIVEVEDNRFSLSLIPETLKQTLLGKKKEGDIVNLEFDNNAKILVETLNRIVPKIVKNI